MFVQSQLISPTYRDLQVALHTSSCRYGERGDKWAGVVLQLAAQYQATSILDYGCGSGSLAACLKPLGAFRVDEYDPAIPGKDDLPSVADMVVCSDVLEHVERRCFHRVLQHLRMLARKVLWVVVATQKTDNILADGRNAHLIVRPGSWWKQRMREAGFTLHVPPTIVRRVPEKEWCAVLTP